MNKKELKTDRREYVLLGAFPLQTWFFTGLWKQKYKTVKLSRFSSPVPLLRDCIESSLTTLNSVLWYPDFSAIFFCDSVHKNVLSYTNSWFFMHFNKAHHHSENKNSRTHVFCRLLTRIYFAEVISPCRGTIPEYCMKIHICDGSFLVQRSFCFLLICPPFWYWSSLQDNRYFNVQFFCSQ